MSRHLWWIVGVLLVCAGLVIASSTRVGPHDGGWFAYTPLTSGSDWRMAWADSAGGGAFVIVSRWQVAGCAMAALGTAVVAGGIGYHLGRRRARPSTRRCRRRGPTESRCRLAAR